MVPLTLIMSEDAAIREFGVLKVDGLSQLEDKRVEQVVRRSGQTYL